MSRYRLRTLLIVLAIGPPVLAGWWLEMSRSTASMIAILVCVLIGLISVGPILVAWNKQRS
jgi:hypothetical protein